MKKAVSIFLCTVLIALSLTTAIHAQIINREGLISTEEALTAAGGNIPVNRVYLKVPANDAWHSSYSIYQGKYWPSVYWWESIYAPLEYPGCRMSIDNYAQGIYYAVIPDGTPTAIFGNGFGALEAERETEKYRALTNTDNINIEGADEGDYDTLPEGSPTEWNFDGCIYVIDPESAYENEYTGRTTWRGSWYIYYGDGCYGSYAETSDSFTGIEDNCLNPDHFDGDGNHIGGAHIKPYVAPDDTPDTAPASTVLNGYYLVSSNEPQTVRSENKLYPSADGEYRKYLSINKNYQFRIVYYQDGVALDDSKWYPEQGYYNENGDLIDTWSAEYMLYFRPEADGDSSYIDGCLKLIKQEETPTEVCTEPVIPDAPYHYKARFGQEYAGQYKENEWYYKELYYHRDENGETDWALVYAMLPTSSPIELVTIVGNRVLSPGTQYEPFDAGYGIYDVKEDKFIDAGSLSAKNCPDFVRVFDKIVTEGRLIGDLDQDNAITVFDATLLQRCDVGLRDYPEDDVFYVTYEWGSPRYYSDFDRDGDRTIIDATLIQRYLVGIA